MERSTIPRKLIYILKIDYYKLTFLLSTNLILLKKEIPLGEQNGTLEDFRFLAFLVEAC